MLRKSILIPSLLIAVSIGFGCNAVTKMLARSGTEFRIQIESTGSDPDALVERAVKITESRINSIGLAGDVVRDPENASQFIVRLYGVKDLERIKKFLFTSYELELQKAVSPPNPEPLQTFSTAEAAVKVAVGEQEVLPYEIREGAMDRFVIVEKTPIINGDDIRDASVITRSGSYDHTITFSLKTDGSRKFGEWTGKNKGNYLAVVLNKKVQSVAYIKSQIFDSGEISGRFGKEEAEDIALSLKSGYLPATMKIVGEQQIEK